MTTTILLDGRDVTGVTLDGVKITRGRESLYENPTPGVCVANLLSGDIDPAAWQGVSGYTDAYADVWVGLEVAARVGVPMVVITSGVSGYTDAYEDVWAGAGTIRFTGTVTAVDYTPGELTITAVDAVESLGRVYVNTGRPQETDFARAYAYAHLANVELGYTGTTTANLIETAPPEDPTPALTALNETADNTDATLYADKDNRLWYRRRDTAITSTVTLPTDITLVENLVVSEELGAIYNIERVTYGKDADQRTVERINPASVTKYGRREWRGNQTQLLNGVDATALAEYWLSIDQDPGYLVKNINVIALDDTYAHILDNVDLFTLVTIPLLPAGSPIESYRGVVLGYTETINQNTQTLALALAPAGYLTEGTSYAVTATT